MRYERRPDYKELQKRYEVSAYIPPVRAEEVAQDRTRGMVEYFFTVARHVDYLTAMRYVERLAQSAYLQGVSDAGTAMAMTEKGGDV